MMGKTLFDSRIGTGQSVHFKTAEFAPGATARLRDYQLYDRLMEKNRQQELSNALAKQATSNTVEVDPKKIVTLPEHEVTPTIDEHLGKLLLDEELEIDLATV